MKLSRYATDVEKKFVEEHKPFLVEDDGKVGWWDLNDKEYLCLDVLSKEIGLLFVFEKPI